MKNRLLGIATLALLVACGGQDVNLDSQITVPVSVQDIELEPIEEYISATGTVQAMKEAVLISEIEGYYELQKNSYGKLLSAGTRVKKGDLIIKLENPETENNIKIESQKLTLDITKREYEKQQSLYEKGGVTLYELVNSERAYKDAQYNYDNALIQLSKMKITAPFDGIITFLPYHTPGVKVPTNTAMVTIMNYDKLYLELDLSGNNFGQVKTNQKARITNYTVPDDTLIAQLTQVSPALDTETRSFQVSMTLG